MKTFTGKPSITSIEIETNTALENINVVKEGYFYDLNCKVDYSNELNSTIQWFRNEEVVSSSENYTTEVVNLENDGDTYECKYNDALDSDSKLFKLDVQCKFVYKLYNFWCVYSCMKTHLNTTLLIKTLYLNKNNYFLIQKLNGFI